MLVRYMTFVNIIFYVHEIHYLRKKRTMKTFTIILFSILSFSGNSQSLVPNPDFEIVSSSFCGIMGSGDFESTVNNWNVPTMGTPDAYFDNISMSCYNFQPNSQYIGVIGIKGQQLPRSGHVMGGFTAFSINGLEQREYLQIPLTSPTIVGASYVVECYVSHADFSEFTSDGIGLYLSPGAIGSSTTNPLPFTPQVVAGTVIQETVQWVRIFDTITVTDIFNYVTIGNFFSDAATTRAANPGFSGGVGTYGSYFFIDDVRVERVTVNPIGVDELEQSELVIYPNPFLDGITIELPDVGGEFELELFNLNGEVLLTQTGLSSDIHLVLDHLSPGVYLVNLRNEGLVYTQRIVK